MTWTSSALGVGVAALVLGCASPPPATFAPVRSPPSTTSGPPSPAARESISVESLRGVVAWSAEAGSAEDHDVFVLDLDAGGRPRRLTGDPAKEFDPELSPDGAQIAYRVNPDEGSDDADVWVINVDGSGRRNLTNAPELSNWAPTWTPDGRIAFSSRRDGATENELWTMAADGSDVRRVAEGWCEYARPSPDGAAFVCAGNVGRRFDLFVVSTATGERRAVTSTLTTEFGPAWSPDGTLIAFARDLGTRWALMTIRPDGSDEHEVAEEGVFPTWDPDGHLVWTGPGGINVARADGSGRIALDYAAEFVSWRR